MNKTVIFLGSALVLCLALLEVKGDECPENEEYKECGTACPATCANRFTFKRRGACIAVCRDGCFCKAGYLRNRDRKCVPPQECS
ncbi:chymotrypsin inhibitor-like [Hyperolius riggenbachi]|uniref:chymotrypsin inhibitor-like n=1 Tax=Hyperolius riggenbachi TaxID=752182 RepID=UPI0035A2CC17